MTLTYRITADDYVRANRRHSGRVWRSPRGLILAVVVGAVWAGLIALDLPGAVAMRALWFVLLSLGFAVAFW